MRPVVGVSGSQVGRVFAGLLLLALCVGVPAAARAGSSSGTQAAAVRGLHVKGNKLLNATGQVVRFHGANRSGTEYACIQGWGIFDGPSNASSVKAMKAWHVNAMRIPLNEDCWLGINGVKPQYSGRAYRRAIVNYVRLLNRNGIYAELSLMWGAPGTYRATYQPAAPDKDHSPAMWKSLAATFRHNGKVVLAPWGETIVNANCFLRGGVCEATFGPNNKPYATAGMQQAVSVMRKAGYRGPIVIPGIDYANNLSNWLSHKPRDPLHQLMAEAHIYGKNTCSSVACFNRTLAPVARRVPLIFGETGESYDGSDCGSSQISTFMNWADAHGVGYEAWTWNTWGNCEALISSYAGAPYGTYGAWIKSHYASLH
jgi:Cellulase (glycosyl hydrolase family 5)